MQYMCVCVCVCVCVLPSHPPIYPSMASNGTHVAPHFTKHAIPVVPDAEEPQNMSVQLQELLQLVKRAWGGEGVVYGSVCLCVGV